MSIVKYMSSMKINRLFLSYLSLFLIVLILLAQMIRR